MGGASTGTPGWWCWACNREFVPTSGIRRHRLPAAGDVVLLVDRDEVAGVRVDATAAMGFSADDTCDVGREGGALVTTDYGRDNAFTGTVRWVQLDVDDETRDVDPSLTVAERLRIAMARQ